MVERTMLVGGKYDANTIHYYDKNCFRLKYHWTAEGERNNDISPQWEAGGTDGDELATQAAHA